IVPLHPAVLDLLFAISIVSSVLILMTSLLIKRPLEFACLPPVQPVATLFRLGLSLASTRLILSHGHEGGASAGKVIEAFGALMMSGSFIIGVIVFAILLVVNFVVITKGSTRIAEVAARFTLDSMPGKQMAIDADLSAGLIDEATAKARRLELEQESTFFGAMDGAAKFVRGDAIAGLLIVFINIIAGMVIGIAQNDMPLGEAADTYTHLTIGDGLISQIPALIVSVAAGMLVSKAGVQGSADKAIFAQLSKYPQALVLCALAMFFLGLMPGIPMLPFFFMGGVAGFFAWQNLENAKKAKVAKEKAEQLALEKAPVAEEPIAKSLAIDTIRLELGYGLLPLVNNPEKGRLTEQIKGLRKQLAEDMGF